MADIPAVPLTLEGATVLHQMFRLRRSELRKRDESAKQRMAEEMSGVLTRMEQRSDGWRPLQSAAYSMVGHKGDLLLVHFRESLDAAHCAELELQRLEMADYLEPIHSYLSVVELGLYESTAKTYRQLAESNREPHSPEWNAGIEEVLGRQRAAMEERLWPKIPGSKYICFYPMDRKRGESKNWYQETLAERQRMMHEHGMIGRRYAGQVKQIITGSIGFDDWEWGVDLFADDPLIFKKLIYEMRFDEVSAVFALFGSFYVGIRIPAAQLGEFLTSGKLM
jgi:peroxiredoxin